MQPILAQYCGGCHGEPAQSASADYFCLLQYKRGEATPPCSATDTGAFEMRGAIYGRLVTLVNYTPALALGREEGVDTIAPLATAASCMARSRY